MEESESRRNRRTKQFEGTCPACDAIVRVRKPPKRGQLITCKDCDSLLVVTRSAPLRFEWAFEEPTSGDQYGNQRYVEESY
jgi:RNase P subunit RPR2